jgi:predicted  nucleic acid-binding Zn-ribbon protein
MTIQYAYEDAELKMTVGFERARRIEIEREIEIGRWQRRAVHAERLTERLFEEITRLKAEITQLRTSLENTQTRSRG